MEASDQGRRMWSGRTAGAAAIVIAMASVAALVLAPLATAAPVRLSEVGSLGVDAGELYIPQDLTLDRQGNLYVADGTNARIDVFDRTGAFRRAFGYGVVPGGPAGYEVCTTATTCKEGIAGDGPGQLTLPSGVAIHEATGRLYVSVYTN